MIALTKEKREKLIRQLSDAIEDLSSLKDDTDAQWTINIYKIALASLTAEYTTVRPFGLPQILGEGVWVECEPSEEGATQFFTEPPVPELKLPVPHLGEEHNDYFSGKQDGWNHCLTTIKRLNGLGD